MNGTSYAEGKNKMSAMRKNYIMKFVGRCAALVICIALCFLKPEEFDVLDGMNFFSDISLLHILWAIWVADMLMQLIPLKKYVPLGSQKLFKQRYVETGKNIDKESLKKYISRENKKAAVIFAVWAAITVVLGALKYQGIINDMVLFAVCVFFYVCDLFCVLIWCPFRYFMKNRCCTTCRIFNWDHLMMFAPFVFVEGFYAKSLLVMAIAIWIIWEYMVIVHPERFWVQSNEALKCVNCKDKLCTQYCEKNKAM